MNIIKELEWRGLIQDIMPGTEELLNKENVNVYCGVDPTSSSMHVGNLVPVMLIKHLQRAGHKPIALVGGATGMIGDPSGKSEERVLLDEKTLKVNEKGIEVQLRNLLDFSDPKTGAELVNNYDWMKDFSVLHFLRDVGKHITVNYMMAKDSVKKRLETGISFTEFSYQLIQGYDFLRLYETMDCKLQVGGSDQWGNMVTGTELIRRKTGGEAFAFTCPLLTKADGQKFGKTEQGNVWLDPDMTSPYAFYQFWLNVTDEEAEKNIKIFTFRNQEEIEALTQEHKQMPHLRILQHALAEDVTSMIHGKDELERAQKATEILFGKGTADLLESLDERTLLSAMEGVPQYNIGMEQIKQGINIVELLATDTAIMPSKGEARKMLKGNGISINKEKQNDLEYLVTDKNLIGNRYILVQKGKKNYFLIKAG